MADSGESSEPSVVIGELQLWVHGRQFPDQHDFWDGNWLNITAKCESSGASVEVTGALLRNTDLDSFLTECRRLHATLEGEACLKSLEPNLSVRLRSAGRGHIPIEIEITPDHLNQRHRFESEIDQSYLPGIMRSIERLLERLPIRDAPGASN